MMYLDLAELEEVFQRRWLWSTRGFNLAWLRRRDHLGDPSTPLDKAVRDLVARNTGQRPDGPIRLLTHLRYFGVCFNPVSFYYCFDKADKIVVTIVAEVNNTPWGERHCYVLPIQSDGQSSVSCLRFEKRFHVSPFMPMEQNYEWQFSPPGETLAVHMENHEISGKVFDATLTLERFSASPTELAKTFLWFPFMSLKVIVAIYYEAFKLWRKKIPFHAHPTKDHDLKRRGRHRPNDIQLNDKQH